MNALSDYVRVILRFLAHWAGRRVGILPYSQPPSTPHMYHAAVPPPDHNRGFAITTGTCRRSDGNTEWSESLMSTMEKLHRSLRGGFKILDYEVVRHNTRNRRVSRPIWKVKREAIT